MILILILLVGLGLAFYFGKNYCEEEAMYTLVGTIALTISVACLHPYVVQYKNYTESYSLQPMSDGKYYNISNNKVSVMISDDTMQKPKTFPNKIVSFVNGNTASIQIQRKRSSNDDLIKMLFFSEIKDEEKEIIKNVIISVPGNNSENLSTEDVKKPLAENFCTSCGASLKETDQFCSTCGQKIKSEQQEKGGLTVLFLLSNSDKVEF